MGFLNKEGLLKKQKLKIVRVDLDNGEFVFVKQMNGTARDRFERTLSVEVKNEEGATEYQRALGNFRAKLAVCTLSDEKGNLLLKEEDVESLSDNMSAGRLELIVNKAQELNKISDKDKDNLVKNSSAVPSGASISDSAENSGSPTLTIS